MEAQFGKVASLAGSGNIRIDSGRFLFSVLDDEALVKTNKEGEPLFYERMRDTKIWGLRSSPSIGEEIVVFLSPPVPNGRRCRAWWRFAQEGLSREQAITIAREVIIPQLIERLSA